MLTIIEYKFHGEGVYKEGILVKGIFYKWSEVVDSKISKISHSDKLVWTIYLQAIRNSIATRTIVITKEQASKIEETLRIFLEKRE